MPGTLPDPGVVHDLGMAEIRDREDLLAHLRALPPLERVKVGRLLANVETAREIRRITDEAVYELTRDASRAQVAEQLGVGEASINKAIARHRGQPRPRGKSAE